MYMSMSIRDLANAAVRDRLEHLEPHVWEGIDGVCRRTEVDADRIALTDGALRALTVILAGRAAQAMAHYHQAPTDVPWYFGDPHRHELSEQAKFAAHLLTDPVPPEDLQRAIGAAFRAHGLGDLV